MIHSISGFAVKHPSHLFKSNLQSNQLPETRRHFIYYHMKQRNAANLANTSRVLRLCEKVCFHIPAAQCTVSSDPHQWHIIPQDRAVLCTAVTFCPPGSWRDHPHMIAGMSDVPSCCDWNELNSERWMSPWEHGTPFSLPGKLMAGESHLDVIMSVTSDDSRECSHWWNRVA